MNGSTRHRQAELMDQPDLAEAEHLRALAGLRRINSISRSSRLLWPDVRRLAERVRERPLRILDVACGGGDVTVGLAQLGRRQGIELAVTGCDISPVAIGQARRVAAESGLTNVEFRQQDVLREPLPDGFDVVTCSLFLHHLAHDEAVELLRRMAAAARRLVLVNDLRRSRLGYWTAWGVCRLLTRSPVVRFDGPVSVAAAFTMPEALELAGRAGLSGASISSRWPFRFVLAWSRD